MLAPWGMAALSLLHRWILVIVLAATWQGGVALVLEGSPTSYAQFKKWFTGLNGTLSLEFQTEEPNGLLLYTDDGGTYDFFELKLVEGVLRLRFNLGGGTSILTVGRNLHDSQWHRVEVGRNVEETVLRVDDETQKRLSPGGEFQFGNLTTNSEVYVGGLPDWYSSKLTLLALPSVFFEPRFKGAIRNLLYASEEGNSPRRQEVVDFQGVRSNQLDICEHQDPCQHDSLCISTDTGAVCDCKGTDFEGEFCDKEKAPSDVTFSGTEYLYFDLRGSGGEPIVSSSDEITLYFKTSQAGGLLLYTGDGEDYLNLALKSGGLVVTVGLGSGSIERVVRPARVRFDDNQWHKVSVHRKVREITRATGFCHLSITVDGVYTERGSTAGSFSLLSSSVLFIGGSDQTSALPGSRVQNNFVGCMRKVEFVADSISLDLVGLAKSGSKLLRHHGNIQFHCHEIEAADPITFTTRESFLVLPSWEASRSGTISFKFRTNEATGLLMYNSGAAAQRDFFAFELLDGHVYLLLDLGSEAIKTKTTTRRVDDGEWHSVSLQRTGKSGRVTVDESAADFTAPGNSNQLDLEGPLYVGGIASNENLATIPNELWSAKMMYGFVGCIRDLVVNGKVVDIGTYAKEQDSGSIRPSCHTSGPQCESQPCLNGGHCLEGWNRYICDCSLTSFTGPVCAKGATTLSFDGGQYMKINFPEGSHTQAEDIYFRFRTQRPSGVILATTSDKSPTFLVVALDGGRIKLLINLGTKQKIYHLRQGLNDDQWHTVHIKRRGHKIDLQVDSDAKSHDLGEGQITLDVHTLHVGAVTSEVVKPIKETPNFVGHMQHLTFNRKPYLEMAHSGQMNNFQVTAKFGKKDHIVHHPITFKSKYTFIGLPQLKAYSSINLYFQFKTLEPNGLILYNGGKGQDFICIEFVNGHLHYVFNLGDGPRKVRSNSRNTLNDNQWHAVTIGRPSPHQHTLMVDDMITKVTSTGSNIHLDLDGILYLGGVRRSLYNSLPKLVHSRHGFEGCLASLDLNGETMDPIKDSLIPSTLVSKGCAGPITKCSNSACANHGVCVQMWNSYTCDCDMTSFSGPICADESIAYEFGPGTGVVTFLYAQDKQPDTKSDLLALGFITMADNAVLVRIDSGSSNDYLELEIVDGNIFMVYNMGTEDHPIGEHSVHVNDGQYHVVRFTRSGPNSTIQVDDHNVRTKHPKGRQLAVFNSHSKIQVGGKKNPIRGAIERPFQGIISGLVFNGHRILDMAAEDDPRLTVEGDVELLMSLPYSLQQRSVPPHNEMQQQPGASPMYEGDDLVFSGGGSGCWDDEDDCGVLEFGSGDDLITPVYIPPTPKPKPHRTTSTSPRPTYIPGRSLPGGMEDTTCDDEEDCIDGSGVGELVFPGPTEGVIYKTDEIITPSRPPEIRTTPAPPPPPAPMPTQRYNNNTSTIDHTVVTHRPTVITVPTPPRIGGSTTRAPPVVYGVPIPEMPATVREKQKPHPKAKSSADNTALVIGIIAGVLIAIVLIALVVYKVRNRTAGNYKVDEGKNFNFPPQSGSPVPYNSQPPSHMNGVLKTTEKMPKPPKKKDVKDLKEWYV